MKRHSQIFILLLLSNILSAQFITIKNKQFHDGSGQPYFPLICNYVSEMTFIKDRCDIFDLSPGAGYGTPCRACFWGNGSNYEEHRFGDGTEFIGIDFKKIKSMGFNAVRYFGLDFRKNDENGGYINAREYPFVKAECKIEMYAPYSADSNFKNILVPNVKRVLQLAGQAGIKIILLAGRGYLSNTKANSNDYRDFLAALAAELRTDTNLLAYDFDNEPHWSADYGRMRAVNKNDIYHYINSWYDAVKAADPNHLITMGNCDLSDIFDYDASILKLDFNSYHLYPFFDIRIHDGFDREKALERLKTYMYWISNHCPIPWIIGETGASAHSYGIDTCCPPAGWFPPMAKDTCEKCGNTGFAWNHYMHDTISKWPWAWGTYADQAACAKTMLEMAHTYGASGFAWWDFQDVADYGWWDGPTHFRECHNGLLQRGNPIKDSNGNYYYPDSLDKPIVQVFKNHIAWQQSLPPEQPADYYNPYKAKYDSIVGTVKDINGVPIKDAVIKGFSWTGNWPYSAHSDKPGEPEKWFEVYTFTDSLGRFVLKSAAPRDTANGYNTSFAQLKVSSVGGQTISCDIDKTGNLRSTCPANFEFKLKPALADRLSLTISINKNKNQQLTIEHRGRRGKILILDAQKNKVYSSRKIKFGIQNIIDIENLKPGTYTLQVKSGCRKKLSQFTIE